MTRRRKPPKIRRQLLFVPDYGYVWYTLGCYRCGCIRCRGSLTEEFSVSAAGIPESKEAMHRATRFDQCFARPPRCYHSMGQICPNRRGGRGAT